MHTSPETAIILGTGLGSLVHEITDKYEISYKDIPNFPVSTVEGHSGKLIFGKLGNKDIMAMQGRFHFYEGYSMKEVTFPVRVMRELGIKTLFVSNAAGGTNADFEIGDLMIIRDHINFFPEHPLHGKNIEYGPRFPDMSEAYSKELIDKALEIAKEKGIKVQQGVYIGTQGPTFETPAEYKMFHILGADAATSYADSSVCSRAFALSPATLIATPNSIENTTIAIIFSFDKSLLKSDTVRTFTILSNILISSVVVSTFPLLSSNDSLIFTPSDGSTSFIGYVVTTPTITATSDITTNVKIMVTTIFPSLLGCFIFDIDVVMLKNINGTIVTNSRFKKRSPNGFKTAAFSLHAIPIIAPITIAAKSIITDL